MDDIIHFRSKYTHERSIGGSHREILGRSSEVSELRNFEENDDARDIFWKKSTTSSIYTRNRRVNSSIDIVFVPHGGEYDREKRIFMDQIKLDIEKSCRFNGDRFSFMDMGTHRTPYISEIKNKLVIIATSSIEGEGYEKLCKSFAQNDVLFVMIFHSYEIENTGKLIFESRIPTKKYYREIGIRLDEIQKMLHSHSKSNIVLRTEDNIVLKLNHFFKHRYG